MHVLIVDSRPERQEAYMVALLEAGMLATGSGSLIVAETCLRRMPVDALIVERRSAGTRLAGLLRLAETANPHISSLLLTPDVPGDSELLLGRVDSLHGIVDSATPPSLALKLITSSMGQSAGLAGFAPRVPSKQSQGLFQSVRASADLVAA